MKNLSETSFNIEKTTMRELNQSEIHDVAGGTGGVVVTITIVIALTWPGEAGSSLEDPIFEGGFEQD